MKIRMILLYFLFILFGSCNNSVKENKITLIPEQDKKIEISLLNSDDSVTTIKKANMRSLEELINKEDPGIALVKEWLKDAKNHIEMLPRDLKKAEQALYHTQVTTRSVLGSIIYETGGILVNNGWLRILGSGHPKLNRNVPEWSRHKSFDEYGEQPSFLLIADDIIGGFFAMNGGGISDQDLGKIFYFAPDTMEWESTGYGYTDFIYWCFTGDLDLFYKGFFWKGYEEDLKNISGTEAVSFFPFLWTKEGKDINNASRKIIPIQEIWDFSMDKTAN